MMKFLSYLFVFSIGFVLGAAAGGVFGGAAGGYIGACEVVDSAVAAGTLTQDEANATIRQIASQIGVRPKDKERILEALKRSGQPQTPCSLAIAAL